MNSRTLKDLLVLSDSGVWGDEDETSGVNILRSTNFNSDGTLDFSKKALRFVDLKVRNSKFLQSGDILLEKSGGGPRQPVGRVCLYRGDSSSNSFGNFIARLRPSEDIVPEYLFFFLRYFHISGRTAYYQKQTTGIRNLEFKRYLSIEVPLPLMGEQQRTVDLLARAESILRLRREAEKKAAELVPALFIQMFGDPSINPKAWPLCRLDDVAQIISGVTKGRKLGAEESVELPYMRVANVKDGYLDLSDIKTIAVRPSEIDKYRLQPGDLLLTEGGDPDKLGRGALWSGEIECCLHQNHIFKVRAQEESVLPEYLLELVGSHYGKAYFLSVAKKTTGIASINRTQLGRFPVLLPPMALQRAFVDRVSALRALQSQQAAATAQAQASFDALLARAFAA